MPYGNIVAALDVMAIAEREFGVAAKVRTTNLDSCIAVVGRVTGQNTVIAIHLVILGDNGAPFDDAAADQVKAILNAQNVPPNKAWLIGRLEDWKPKDSPGYIKLCKNLGEPFDDPDIRGQNTAQGKGIMVQPAKNADDFTVTEV